MKRKIFISAIILIIGGIIITSIFIYKNNNDNKAIPAKINETTQSNSIQDTSSIPTPSPEEQIVSPTQTTAPTEEPDAGQILFERKVDLDGDKLDEDVKIEKILDKSDNQQNDDVLTITGKTGTLKVPYLKRSVSSMLGAFTGIEFVDLDNDGLKDVFITIPEAEDEFNINYFFAYTYKKQKSYSYQKENKELVRDFMQGFNLNYAGDGILNIENNTDNFKGGISLKDNAGFSNSEELNKTTYSKAWIATTPMGIDPNAKLILQKSDNSQTEIKIPFPIFGQTTSDILGEIDTYFIFNNDFVPVLKSFEVQEFHGNDKKLVGSKIIG